MPNIPKMTTKEEVLAKEKELCEGLGLTPILTAADIDMPEPGYPELDGMPAHEWLDAMYVD